MNLELEKARGRFLLSFAAKVSQQSLLSHQGKYKQTEAMNRQSLRIGSGQMGTGQFGKGEDFLPSKERWLN
jgi:hypothetical protein